MLYGDKEKRFVEAFLCCVQKRWTVHNNVCLDCPLRIAPKAILTTRFAVQMTVKVKAESRTAEGADFRVQASQPRQAACGLPRDLHVRRAEEWFPAGSHLPMAPEPY